MTRRKRLSYRKRVMREWQEAIDRAQPTDYLSPWFGLASFVMALWWARKTK